MVNGTERKEGKKENEVKDRRKINKMPKRKKEME